MGPKCETFGRSLLHTVIPTIYTNMDLNYWKNRDHPRKVSQVSPTSQKTFCLHYKYKPISAVKGNNPFFCESTSNIKIHRVEN